MQGRGLQLLRYLGLLLGLFWMLAGCGSNGGSSTTGSTASRSRQLSLQLQLSSEAGSTAPPAGRPAAQTRQMQPGDPGFLDRLAIRLQTQGSDLVPPQVFLLDPAQQEAATLEVAVPDTAPTTFEVLISALTSQGIEAYRGQTTVARGQTSAMVVLPRFAFVPVPATAANVQHTTFTFPDGAVFGLADIPVTLATGTFTGDVGDFALTASGAVASGSVTIGSCTFVVTTTSFPPGQGLQVDDTIVIDPCQIDAIDRRLIVTNISVSDTPTISSTPVVIPSDTTLTVPPPATLTLTEDTPGTFQIVTSVSGPRPGTTSLGITVPPAHGTASLTSAGVLTYQPADNFTGTDSLVVTVIVLFTDTSSPPLLLGTVPISIIVTSASLVAITVTPANPQLAQGTTQAFTATGLFTDSSTQDLTTQVTWQSSNPVLATISNAPGTQGRASGIAPGGPIVISATAPPSLGGTITGSTLLSVSAASLVSITVTPPNAQLARGATQAFTATGLFTDTSVQDLTTQVTWQSSDVAVATISNAPGTQGRASGIAPGGPIVISATAPPSLGGTITGSTLLSVSAASLVSITVTPPNAQLARGATQAFTATGLFTDSSTQDLTTQVTWQSSNPALATISNAPGTQGRATGVAPGGPIVISATAPPSLGGTITGTAQLSVTAASLVSITVTPPNAQLARGATQAFTATGLFTDTSVQDLTTQVTWQSSDVAVATISNAPGTQGRATGVAPGGPIVISAIAPPSLGGTITGTAQLSVLPFNNPPSFMLGPNQTVLENAGPQTVAPWATAISPGPPDEANQAVNFIVSTSNTALFTVLPAISPNGTLTYTPAVQTNGVAVVTVRLQDNGGIANGGMDTSPPQTFTITVVDHRPPTFASILATPPLARAGVTITITFNVSEALQSNPTVIVAGNPATFRSLAGLTYAYIYVVQGTEPVGTAAITITGTDLAGNVGLGESSIIFDFTPPVATITFPGSSVLTYTQVSVRGTAQDANGVTNVLVNGVAATSTDGFAHWEAVLLLEVGLQQTLSVSTTDMAGNTDVAAASATVDIVASIIGADRGTGPAFEQLRVIAIEASGQALVVDNGLDAVVRVDPATGNRTVVSGCTIPPVEGCPDGPPPAPDNLVGSGPEIVALQAIAIEASGQALVVDNGLDAVVRVDPATGNRTVVSGCTIPPVEGCPDGPPSAPDNLVGSGPEFANPVAIAIEASGQWLVVDRSLGAVVRVDPATGNRTVVSGCTIPPVEGCPDGPPPAPDNLVGSGPEFADPVAIAIEASGQWLVVDSFFDAVVRVDPATGNRTVVSGCTIPGAALCPDGPPPAPDNLVGSGPEFINPVAIAIEASGQWLVVDTTYHAVVRVDPATGNRTVVSGCTNTDGPCLDGPPPSPDNLVGSGPEFEAPLAIAVEASGQALVVDGSLDIIVRVDAINGDRAIISGSDIDVDGGE